MIKYIKQRYEFLLDVHFDYPDQNTDELESFGKVYEFIEQVYEIAYGDDAIDKDYSEEEVLQRLKEFSENSWKYEDLT